MRIRVRMTLPVWTTETDQLMRVHARLHIPVFCVRFLFRANSQATLATLSSRPLPPAITLPTTLHTPAHATQHPPTSASTATCSQPASLPSQPVQRWTAAPPVPTWTPTASWYWTWVSAHRHSKPAISSVPAVPVSLALPVPKQ